MDWREEEGDTSGIPAASSHESSGGLCRSICVETAIYSA